jgi:LacI family transcriptional regulator
MGRRKGARGATIIDVAAAAGVSTSTVSRVLRSGGDVSDATRRHVESVVHQLGYRPSSIARALVSGESKLLALLVSDLSNPFYPQLAKSVERAASEAGYAVVICNTDDDDTTAIRYLERLSQQGLDGVIYASGCGDEDRLVTVLGDPRRIVFVNRRPSRDSWSYVVSDNKRGARLLTEHLLGLGHRHIGFVGGPDYATNAIDRAAGFHQALHGQADATGMVSVGPFSKETGLRTVQRWLDSGFPLTAVIGVNDTVALGALEAILERGLRVPEDIAVAGFDNVDLASSTVLHLTTVAQDIEAMGRRAVAILLDQLSTSEDVEPTQVVLEPTLVPRRTSGHRLGASVSGADSA